MKDLGVLILFNVILVLILVYTQKCNNKLKGGDGHEDSFDSSIDNMKNWCIEKTGELEMWANRNETCKKLKKIFEPEQNKEVSITEAASETTTTE
tara:strand:- start:1866 stop:2150 length:285 start_codon:yes stop_codon:yes gene_type:complete